MGTSTRQSIIMTLSVPIVTYFTWAYTYTGVLLADYKAQLPALAIYKAHIYTTMRII